MSASSLVLWFIYLLFTIYKYSNRYIYLNLLPIENWQNCVNIFSVKCNLHSYLHIHKRLSASEIVYFWSTKVIVQTI